MEIWLFIRENVSFVRNGSFSGEFVYNDIRKRGER